MRIAGTRGVIETALIEKKVTLITEGKPPRTLPLTQQTDIFTQFARSLRGEGPPPLTLHEACRITEIAIKAQQAADTKAVVSLSDSCIARLEPPGTSTTDFATRFRSGNLQAQLDAPNSINSAPWNTFMMI